MTDRFDDTTLEHLNAYLDGELDASARAAFEARLQAEPALQKLYEQMRAVSSEVSAQYGAPPADPPGEQLMAALKSFAAAQAVEPGAAGATVIPFEPRAKAVEQPGGGRWQLPLAAVIAFTMGAGAAWLALRTQGGTVQQASVAVTNGTVAEGAMLHRVLERVESGSAEKAGREVIRPILSFKAKDGRYCREFEAFGSDGAVVGVACRVDKGWTMEVLLSAAPPTLNETQYAPASGFNAKALDDVVSQLMEGGALDAAAEAEALKKGWQKSN